MSGRLVEGATEIPMMLNATTGLGESLTEHVFPVDVLPSHDFVPRFWAYSRIQDLKDLMKYNGTDTASVREITDLAIDFHFVTDYTSLFVELPEDIQERFDNSTEPYPAQMASSDDHPATLASSMTSTGNRRTPFDGTTGSTGSIAGAPDPAPTTNDVDHSLGDGSNDQKYTRSVQVKGTASCDPDSDGLPDIEESYDAHHFLERDKVIIPSGTKRDAEGGSGSDVTLGVPISSLMPVLVILLIPMSAVLLVSIHWIAIGRKRYRAR